MIKVLKFLLWILLIVFMLLAVLFGYITMQKGSTQASHMTLDEIKTSEQYTFSFPNREEMIAASQSGRNFDVVVIGGGAIGSGACYEASLRGYSTLCLEAGDFASQTSSRSTKLLHGGVRYLEQCVTSFDVSACRLVTEALRERRSAMFMAPHLSSELKLVTPVYDSFFRVMYVWLGLKTYDWLAAGIEAFTKQSSRLSPSGYLSVNEVKEKYPFINQTGLKGAVVYSDGTFNDARMALSLQMSAIRNGAVSLNYVKVVGFDKQGEKITGVLVEDQVTKQQWHVHGAHFINATGPFADSLRKMDNPNANALTVTSPGVHISLPQHKNLPPVSMGVLLPDAPAFGGKKLGSVGFVLPFEGQIIVGTTDTKEDFDENRVATKEEIAYLLNVYNFVVPPEYQYTMQDVISSWVGYRTLVVGDSSKDSKKLSREHKVDVSKSGLVSVMGGKWTTFHAIAREALDAANLKSTKLESSLGVRLIGAEGYSDELAKDLSESFGIDRDIATHLADSYGGFAIKVLDIGKEQNMIERIHPNHPYIWAEVVYAIKHEYARTAQDIISRRMRLDFVDRTASDQALMRVDEMLKQYLN